MIENRKSQRHRVFKAATIEFSRAGGISCIVPQYVRWRRVPRCREPVRHSG